MTQGVLLVAGMLRRYMCLLRPMRGLFKSMRQRYGFLGAFACINLQVLCPKPVHRIVLHM